jgi:uncharacterized membrane protein
MVRQNPIVNNEQFSPQVIEPLLAESTPTTTSITTTTASAENGGDVEQQTVVDVQAKQQIHSRLISLDLFRGLIIVIMAWDHTTHQFMSKADSPSSNGFEIWEGPYATYDNAVRKFLTRNISHICAPGFFFTMGISMILFTISRRERLNWSWNRIFIHHFVRGCVLLLIEYLIDFPSAIPKIVDLLHGRDVRDFSGNEYSKGEEGKLLIRQLFAVYEVMTALGLSMMLAQLAMPLMFRLEAKRQRSAEVIGWLLFILSFIISNVAIVMAQGDNDLNAPPNEFPHLGHKVQGFGQFLVRVFLIPGQFLTNWQSIIYPVFPWIGVTFLGMGFGFVFKRNPDEAHRLLRLVSPVFLLAFFLVRGFGGELNYRGEQRGEESISSSFMQFFIQTKYPPDWAYATITLSVVFLLIPMFNHDMFLALDEQPTAEMEGSETRLRYLICNWKSKGWNHPLYPLLVFGRTPLFFYIAHFWLIQVFEAMFRIPDPPSGKFPLLGVLLVWAFVIAVMYQLCIRYLRFKSSTDPASLWRMF